MKKIAFGFIWFIIFWLGALTIGGAISGGIAGAQVDATTASEGYQQGQAAGYEAGAAFGKKYGRIIFIGSILAAVGGTLAGVLPGTRSRPSQEDA